MKFKTKSLVFLFSGIPSFRFIPGIGASPIGALAFFLGLVKFTKKDLIFLLSYLIVLLTASKTNNGVFECILLMIGPLLMVQASKNFHLVPIKFLMLFIYLVFIDAVIGSILTGGGFRGGTLIMKEPAHAGRLYFFLLSVYICINRRISLHLMILSFLFLVLNKSLFGFVYFSFSVLLLFILANKKKKVIISSSILVFIYCISIMDLSNSKIRFLNQVGVIKASFVGLEDMSQLRTVGFLSLIGSRRVAQSVAGYVLSTREGYGLGNGSLLLSKSAGSNFDLNSNAYIAKRAPSPTSYLSQLFFEAGYVRAIILFMFLMLYLKFRFNSLAVFALLLLMTVSTTTMPFAWLYLGLSRKILGKSS